MHHSDELAGEIALARRFALRGLELDPIDPFVNFTMGRTFWLEGDLESSLAWLERATSISPNYAQGIYASARWIRCITPCWQPGPSRTSSWAANVRLRNPALTRSDFFRAFPMM